MRPSVGVGGAPTTASVTGKQPITWALREYPGFAELNPLPREHPTRFWRGVGHRQGRVRLDQQRVCRPAQESFLRPGLAHEFDWAQALTAWAIPSRMSRQFQRSSN